jgi:hypothetical protein
MLLPWAFRAVQTMGLLVGLRVPRSATRFEVIAHPMYAGPVLARLRRRRYRRWGTVGEAGVEPLEVLFQDPPPDSGMAFVLHRVDRKWQTDCQNDAIDRSGIKGHQACPPA